MSTDTGSGFYFVGGTLHRDAPSYVPRQADEDLYRHLRDGRFCYVLTSRQLGKSSLMVRTAARLRAEGTTAIVLDLTEVGQNLTVEQWYKGLLSAIGEQVGLEDELDDVWRRSPDIGPMQRWMKAVRSVVLPGVRGHVVIFVDEIDAVRSLPFSTDEFFAGIRELFNRRHDASDLVRISFCLLGVAAPTDLIRDTRTTPFNVGERIVLEDFSDAEASMLAQGLVRDGVGGEHLLRRVMFWTQGHPYLTQRLCQAVAADERVQDSTGVDEICGRLFLSRAARDTDDNLLFVRDRILKSDVDLAELLALYRRIRAGEDVPDDDSSPLVSVLKLSGIVRVDGSWLRPRNRIYVEVFDDDWARENLPDADVRRQRRAFKRGLLRAAAVAAVIVAVMADLVYEATVQRNRAEEQRQLVLHEQSVNRRLLYDARINLAYQALDRGDYGRVSQLLAEENSQPDGGNVHGFEYNYLWRQMHSEERVVRLDAVPTDVEYSHDGGLVAVGMSNGSVSVVDAGAGSIIRTLRCSADSVFAVGFDHTDRRVVALCSDQKARVINIASGEVERTVDAAGAGVTAAAFGPDGSEIMGGTSDGLVRVLNLETGVTRTSEPSPAGRVVGVLPSPNGERIATGHDTGDVSIWDAKTLKELVHLQKPDQYTRAAAFSPDGRLIATGSGVGGATLWDAETGKQIGVFETGGVATLRFSPDGRTIGIGTHQSAVELWDVATLRRVASLPGHTEGVFTIAFAPDGSRLVSASPDQTIRFWSAGTKQSNLNVLSGHTDAVSSVMYSPNGKLLASGSYDATAIIWDAFTDQPLHVLHGHAASIRSVAFSPDSKVLATGSDDATVKLWDVATGAELATLTGHSGEVFSVAFSPDGKLLASGSFDDTVRVWDLAQRATIRTFRSDGYSVECVAFSADGGMLAAGGETHTVRVWNTSTWDPVTTIEAHNDWVNSIAFSPDGSNFVSVGSYEDVTVRVWDARRFMQLFVLRGFGGNSGFTNRSIVGGSGRANCARFYPDGTTLAVGTVDRTIKMFDMVTGQEMLTLTTGHTSQVYAIAFSPDGATLASGSEDKTIRVFRASRDDLPRDASARR